MITGERILEVSAKRDSMEGISGLSINIALDDVKVTGDNVELAYEYTANYESKIGFLKIKGVITAKEDKKLADEIKQEWTSKKKLPDKYAEMVLAAINYSGSANGTLVARVLALTAPLIPPRISLGKKP
jgi:galactokinase/mevalonate kinase-like predicted kinase